jgi:hypothetical protein
MWNWIKSLWENKKELLVNIACAYLDGYKPKIAQYIKENVNPDKTADKIVEEIKIYLRQQI